jgi:aldose 1-epimerase
MPIATGTTGARAGSGVERSHYGTMPDGTPVDRFVLRAGRLELALITYGGIIVSLRAPDNDDIMDDVVLGHDSLAGYLQHSPYFGAIVGRFGNRIDRGRFTIDGKSHQLAVNDGPHHLHGGVRGFDKVVWGAVPFERTNDAGVTLSYASPDGDEGYPGRLSASVTYTLTTKDELVIDYAATTDRPTIVNLTQHSYFNLGGAGTPDVLGHELTIHADEYTPVDAGLIPTGEVAPVTGTPFDFREPARIGARIGSANSQLGYAGGYDHNFVLAPTRAATPERDALRHAARLREPTSGRTVDVHTSEPGVQFYSGNFLDGSIRGKGGRLYGHHSGLCLETQHFPDSPNKPHFPSAILRPGDTHRSRTVYTFRTDG